MKKLYLSLSFLAITLHFAQEVQWQRDIPSNTQNFLSHLTTTIDGQYLISGSSIQSGKMDAGIQKQNNGYDYHVLKLNQQGQKVWDKYFSGNQHDYLNATTSTQEGGFLLSGTSYSSKTLDKKDQSFGDSDLWIIKVDENGDEQWQKTLGTQYSEEAKAVVQSADLGYFAAGSSNNPKLGFGSKDAWIIKLDETGKVLNEMYLGGQGLDEVEKIIATKDGGALVGMYSRSGSSLGMQDADSENQNSPTNATQNPETNNSNPVTRTPKQTNNEGEGDYWVVKLNKEGKVEWEKNFGGKQDDHLRTLALTSSGYIIGGESRSSSSGNKNVSVKEGTDLWLISLNENGDEIWQKNYSFKNRDVLMSLNTINNAKNSETKGFLLGGYTQAEGQAEKDDETFWMLYIDGKGEEVWRKYVKGKAKKKEERLVSALLNRDGSYVLAGTSAEELGKENWKIVKLGDKQLENLIETKEISIYPNPVEEYCYVEIGFDFNEATINLYDMSGKQIQFLKTKTAVTKLNTASLTQGIYLITASANGKNVNAKILKK